MAEAYGFDSPTLMGYLAAKTETRRDRRRRSSTSTPAPRARCCRPRPASTTSAGGRAILGLGASGPQVIEGFHGVPYDKPLGRTREIIEHHPARPAPRDAACTTAIFTLPLPEDQGTGLGKPLKLLTKPERAEHPALRRRARPEERRGHRGVRRRLAAVPLRARRRPARSGATRSRAGTAKRHDGLGPLEICAGGMVAIGEGPETKALLDFARPMFALYVGGMGARGKNFYNDLACQYGYEKEAKEIQDLYLGGNKRDAEAMVPARAARGGQPGRPRVVRQGADRRLRRGRRDQPPGHPRLRRPGRDHPPGQGVGLLTGAR